MNQGMQKTGESDEASFPLIRPGRRRRNHCAGSAIIEFALVLPILFVLFVETINFAGFFYAFVNVGNGARAASDYWMTGNAAYSGVSADGSSLGTMSQPAPTTVASLIAA